MLLFEEGSDYDIDDDTEFISNNNITIDIILDPSKTVDRVIFENSLFSSFDICVEKGLSSKLKDKILDTPEVMNIWFQKAKELFIKNKEYFKYIFKIAIHKCLFSPKSKTLKKNPVLLEALKTYPVIKIIKIERLSPIIVLYLLNEILKDDVEHDSIIDSLNMDGIPLHFYEESMKIVNCILKGSGITTDDDLESCKQFKNDLNIFILSKYFVFLNGGEYKKVYSKKTLKKTKKTKKTKTVKKIKKTRKTKINNKNKSSHKSSKGGV